MFEFFANALAFFYDIWPSYGGAIALFTLCIMLLLTPFNVKSIRSILKMQRIAPELKRIQAEHKGDKQAMGQAQMAFYQEQGVNPVASCLPMLLQMPVFLILYNVLLGLTRRGNDGDFNPKYLEDSDVALAESLRATDEMQSFGMDLSQSAFSQLSAGVLTALPYVGLIVLVAVTSWYQQRQTARRRDPNAVVNPQQEMLMKILPYLLVPFSISLPAGVVIYFVVQSLVRIGQQGIVGRLEEANPSPATGRAKPAIGSTSTAVIEAAPPATLPDPQEPARNGKAAPQSPRPNSRTNGSGPQGRPNRSTSRKRKKRKRR